MVASLTLNEATGKKERYPINVTIEAGHAAIRGKAKCCTSVLSRGSNVECPMEFTPGKPAESTLDADLLAEILAKVDADKPAESTIDTTYLIRAEYWMGDDHKAIEDEVREINEEPVQVAGAYAKYRVNWLPDGPVAARAEKRTTKIWKPSAKVKAALLAEANAEVTKVMEE